jgi:LacI family kdg operon repressor
MSEQGGNGAARGHTLVLNLADAVDVERSLAELDRAIDAAAHTRDAGATGNAARVALFAANAPVALCLALHLKARYGADWQARVALLSIDDPEWAELTGVTTIRQPTYEIGYRAVEFLHERIEGVQTTARDCLLPGELIVRASTLR